MRARFSSITGTTTAFRKAKVLLMEDGLEVMCPGCGELFIIGSMGEGDLIECPACQALAEVEGTDPLELVLVMAGEGVVVECPRCGALVNFLGGEPEEPDICEECGYVFELGSSDFEEEEY